MKPTNLTILILLVSSFLPAQTNLDSLWNVWQDDSQADTTRLKAMRRYIWDGYIFSKPDSAFYLAELEYDFAQSRGLKTYMASALHYQGVSFNIRSNYPKALEYEERSLTIYEEINLKRGIAMVLNSISTIYSGQGENAKAMEYAQRCLKIYQESGLQRQEGIVLGNIGAFYNDLGYTTKALDYYQKALRINEVTGDKYGIALMLGHLGNVYWRQGDSSTALDYYKRCLKLFEEIENKDGIATTLGKIGGIFQDQGLYPRALEYFQRSLKIGEETGNKAGIASSLGDIATVFQDQGDYPKALDYYHRSLKIRQEIGNKVGIAITTIKIGRIYHDKGDYAKALSYCQNGLEMAEELKVLLRQKMACQCLYDTYKALGKGNEALVYLEKVRVYEDSLQTEETGKKLQQIEFAKQVYQDSVETYERERQVELEHQEEVRKKNQSRNWSIAGGFLALLLAGGFYSRWRYVQKSKAIIESERDRSDNLLHNILPAEVAAELKEKGESQARDFDDVTVLFTDFVEFTQTAAKLSAQELVSEINACFREFDTIVEKHGIEKIKTIGDAYMGAGGLHIPRTSEPIDVVNAAIEMQAFMLKRKTKRSDQGLPSFDMRVGIHTGPVVAGIVGVKKFQYDIWGDTVNTASRMESHGAIGKVNISNDTYELIKNEPSLDFESRGKIEVKGKGKMEMWFATFKENVNPDTGIQS